MKRRLFLKAVLGGCAAALLPLRGAPAQLVNPVGPKLWMGSEPVELSVMVSRLKSNRCVACGTEVYVNGLCSVCRPKSVRSGVVWAE